MSEALVLVRQDGEEATRHLVRPGLVIGSSRRADLRLRGSGVRRRHAVIEHFSSGLAIHSLGSSPDVGVNDRQVSRHTLRPGDRISIGPAQFVVEESEPDTVWDAPAQEHPRRTGATPADLQLDPVPPQVLARVQKPETTPPMFAGPPVSRRRSVATHRSATWFCLLIVLADAIALGWYLEGI
jgi:pSer/pThr/pTyr-binding forkhead associated (FHA) protein